MRIGHFDLDKEVLVVAEIGNNHEGNFHLAQELIGLAAEAGADAVKFQTIVPEKLVSARQTERIQQLKRFQFSYDEFKQLHKVAQEQNILFLSTPFDIDSALFLEPLVPAYKIASGDNNFWPLIEVAARTGKPMLLSAGITDLEQITRTRDFIYQVWHDCGVNPGLAILHCVVSYPTAPEEASLSVIRQLHALDVTVGYSDHTMGVEAAVLSVALGARVIEKHFTIAKDYSDFHDHQLSADPRELRQLVQRVREATVFLGDGQKRIQQSEQNVVEKVRRSIVAAHDLKAGTVLAVGDIIWVRPGGGLPPGQEADLLGRVLLQPVQHGEFILSQHVGQNIERGA